MNDKRKNGYTELHRVTQSYTEETQSFTELEFLKWKYSVVLCDCSVALCVII
jgi:hypothetical protein